MPPRRTSTHRSQAASSNSPHSPLRTPRVGILTFPGSRSLSSSSSSSPCSSLWGSSSSSLGAAMTAFTPGSSCREPGAGARGGSQGPGWGVLHPPPHLDPICVSTPGIWSACVHGRQKAQAAGRGLSQAGALEAAPAATDCARLQARDQVGPNLCRGAPRPHSPTEGRARGGVPGCLGEAHASQLLPGALTGAGAAAGSGVVDSQKSKSSP